ncbi:GIY-YIG nuclease family protein [Bacillus cihuensis]|uniref:GIY-YIG nuclease family protein n=1 Tax=Bacillus cihuensis TaxID=1208599 RepID=UPI000401EE5D|nr:GIY-YIG nuclease family protein [Bacillus cihuensis]
MERRKELKQIYKETAIEAGVYQIKNIMNERIFIGSTPNLKTLNGTKFMLETGGHKNKMLQEDWNHFGKNAFNFEVLEILKKKKEGYFDVKKELKKLEEKWLNDLQPFGERGYN